MRQPSYCAAEQPLQCKVRQLAGGVVDVAVAASTEALACERMRSARGVSKCALKHPQLRTTQTPDADSLRLLALEPDKLALSVLYWTFCMLADLGRSVPPSHT